MCGRWRALKEAKALKLDTDVSLYLSTRRDSEVGQETLENTHTRFICFSGVEVLPVYTSHTSNFCSRSLQKQDAGWRLTGSPI